MADLKVPDSILQLLDCDDRPSFILNVPCMADSGTLPIVYMNAALSNNAALNDAIQRTQSSRRQGTFWTWLATAQKPHAEAYAHLGLCWTRTVFPPHWAIIGANAQLSTAPRSPRQSPHPEEKTATQTKQTRESLSRFQAIAELVPIGMSLCDDHGIITFANEAWHRITGIPRVDSMNSGMLLSKVLDEDQPNIQRAMSELRSRGTSDVEFRIKRDEHDSPLRHPIGSSPSFERAGLDLSSADLNERHILGSFKAELSSEGGSEEVVAFLTDVTLHKAAAEEANRRAQQAANLQKMAEHATVGIFDMDLDGRLQGANKTFWDICGMERVNLTASVVKPFESCVIDEDMPLFTEVIGKLKSQGSPQSVEFRLKAPGVDDQQPDTIAPRYVMGTFIPINNSEGDILSFTGSLSDVSLQRSQFEAMRQRKDEAIESKRQQENFIDMTSHELRNPLSAIMQCAEAIIASLDKARQLWEQALQQANSPNGVSIETSTPVTNKFDPSVCNGWLELIQSSIHNAETIMTSADHQQVIVNDILTVSKMDSNLLSVTPTTVDPVLIAKQAFRMFELQARRVDIALTMEVHPSYDSLGVEFLDLDPSRLKQILINLLTNAIKFTKGQAIRKVSVSVGASRSRPTDTSSSVEFIPRADEDTSPSSTVSAETESPQDRVFLVFEVKDTGPGLTKEEKALLFRRFVQANAKTHVQYGGSGLGLFICARLTEMQGGAIGVASEPGQGSTFSFYIEAHIPTREALNAARAATDQPSLVIVKDNLNDLSLARAPSTDAPREDIMIEGVLVVEDNLVNQHITQKGLVGRDMQVEVANHGLDALDKLKLTDRGGGHFPLSVITMDMEMPVMDGLSCTRRIRELERSGELKGPRIPIIAVSANAREEQINAAKQAGCDDVLVKPYRILELVEKMKEVLHRLKQREGGSQEHERAPVGA